MKSNFCLILLALWAVLVAAEEPPFRPRINPKVQATKLTQRVSPAYPDAAKQAGISGTVKLNVVIGSDGHPGMVQQVSGNPLLARAAIDAVRQWVYKPSFLNGQPLGVQTEVEVSFPEGTTPLPSGGVKPGCGLPKLEDFGFPLSMHPHTEFLPLQPSGNPQQPQALGVRQEREGRMWPTQVAGSLPDSTATNRVHWWLVDLPAGSYRAVLEMHPEGAKSAADMKLQWFTVDGKPLRGLGHFGSIDKERAVFPFQWESAQRRLLRCSSRGGAAYSLGIFNPNDPVEIPYFSHAQPLPALLPPGEERVVLLSPADLVEGEAVYRVPFCAGPYEIRAEFQRTDGSAGPVGGAVAILGPDADFRRYVIRTKRRGASVAGFTAPADEILLLRVRITGSVQLVRLSVSPAGGKPTPPGF